ncbi:unnamed protein product [Peniophora sp. CBMAI 1063]|nr:unnamed protein product [Peniophora sp. CBMAI 1063]
MTRYTNLGRKRSYVDAGMNYRENASSQAASTSASASAPTDAPPTTDADPSDPAAGTSGTSGPPKKKKRRGKASNEKREAKRVGGEGEGEKGEESDGGDEDEDKGVKAADKPSASVETGEKPESNKAKKLRLFKEKQKAKRKKDDADRAAASEKRRLKRIAERHANKVCFACREMGHAAQLCPNVKPEDQAKGANPAGICYRCGSTRHTLARCRKPENAKNPMPFASCFVCSEQGHLASGCPQNKKTTHLAINCPMRQTDPGLVTAVFGIGREAGADEDDFHTFKRKNVEVDREVQSVEKRMKMAAVRVGKHTGAAQVFGPAPAPVKPKKVVTF